MKKLVTMLSVFALFVVVNLTACKEDDDAAESCQSGTFEVTFNGDPVTGGTFNNTLLKGKDGGVAGKRMDIRVTDAEGRELIITFTDLSTGTSGNGVSTDEYIPIDEISTGTENTFMFTIIEDDFVYTFIDGYLDITSSDADAKLVSGTFSFSDGEEFEVTNGSFTDMCYRIVK